MREKVTSVTITTIIKTRDGRTFQSVVQAGEGGKLADGELFEDSHETTAYWFNGEDWERVPNLTEIKQEAE